MAVSWCCGLSSRLHCRQQIWALTCVLAVPLPIKHPANGLGKAGKMAHVLGPMPSTRETCLKGFWDPDFGPALALAVIWGVN